MTREQKRRTRALLRQYAAAQSGRGGMDAAAMRAVARALEAVRRDDALKARLLGLRYIEGKSVRETVELLYIGQGGTTYHKMDIEALSTAAVVLAESGLRLTD